MFHSRTSYRALSLWVALAIVWGMFVGMPMVVNAQGEAGESSAGAGPGGLPVGFSLSQLPAPGAPHWNGEDGTAVWGAVPNAGIMSDQGYKVYYEWQLYRLDADRVITSANDLQDNERVRFGGIYDESTYSCNLSQWIEEPGYYYFTVFAYGDGVNNADSPRAVSPAFHYTKPAAKLPTPTGLHWQKFEEKYYGVWDDIFGDAYKDAIGFNVTCYEGGNEIYTRLFTRAKLLEDRDSRGRPGAMLYLDNPNGIYKYKVQAVSSNLNQYQSSDWSAISPEVEVRPAAPPPANTGGSSGSKSSGSGRSSRDSSSSARTSARTPVVQNASKISALAATTKSSGETTARSKGTGEVTIQGAAWPQLKGLTFQHDTVAQGAVQVRVSIANPSALTQDIKVSGYVTGKDVERVQGLFGKYYRNTMRVMHLDQAGAWGQEVQIAAKFDLTGMDKNNLVFYSYDKATNSYLQIENPNYSIDKNGYTHFSTPYAGDIIVSDGPLAKK